MPRGQYDRAAAKARRHSADWDVSRETIQLEQRAPHIPGISIYGEHGQPISQADYDAILNQRNRLLRLCQTHGLMVE